MLVSVHNNILHATFLIIFYIYIILSYFAKKCNCSFGKSLKKHTNSDIKQKKCSFVGQDRRNRTHFATIPITREHFYLSFRGIFLRECNKGNAAVSTAGNPCKEEISFPQTPSASERRDPCGASPSGSEYA